MTEDTPAPTPEPPPPPPPRPKVEAYLGEIRLIPFPFAPVGWFFCDGTSLPINGYDALFAVIGTTYGGDGRTFFNLPDLRGRVPVGMGQNDGLNLRLGQTGGRETVQLTTDNLAPHSHTINAYKATDKYPVEGSNAFPGVSETAVNGRSNPTLCYVEAGDTLTTLDQETLEPNRTVGEEFLNLQPYLTLNYIIAVEGLFPPRS